MWAVYKGMLGLYFVEIIFIVVVVAIDAVNLGTLLVALVVSGLVHFYFLFFRCPACGHSYHGNRYFLLANVCSHCGKRRFSEA